MISVRTVDLNEKMMKIQNGNIGITWQNMDLRGVNYCTFQGQFEGVLNKNEKT